MADEAYKDRLHRTLGLKKMPKFVLGDSTGIVNVPGKPGYVFVRQQRGTAFLPAVPALLDGVLAMIPGKAVRMGFTEDGELCVKGPAVKQQLAAGDDPALNNPADMRLYGFSKASDILELYCHAIGTSDDPSTFVQMRAWLYLLNGTWYLFPGGEGGLVDLDPYIPTNPDEHCLACLFINSIQEVEIVASTPKLQVDELGLEDVQECQDNLVDPDAVPGWAWRLYYGQTNITEDDKFLPLRQLINIASMTGAARFVTAPTTASDPGTPNQDIATDGSYFYVCTATDTWKRVAISTW